MVFRYHKNAIITGHVDAFCLVCESHLRTEEDVHSHIAKPIHIKNLDSTGYFEKYKDDCVRKVKKGYFCEFCNILLTTAAKVGLHVAEQKHIDLKGSIVNLKRIGNCIVAFDNVLIKEKAWNGLIDDTCSICNMEFDNEGIHKTDPMHIINLIQSKIELGSSNAVYRKIDETSFQCLTCNFVLAINNLTTHFDNDDHKMKYSECRQTYIAKQKTEKEKTSTELTKEIEKPKSAPLKEQIIPKVDVKKVQQQENTVKKIEPVEVKKDSPEFVQIPIKFEVKSPTPTEPVKKPITEPVKKPVTEPKKLEKVKKQDKASTDLDEEICKVLKAKDYIAVDETGRKWCLLCDWTMDNMTVDMHVNGKHHQTILRMHRERLEKKRLAGQKTEKADSPVEKTETKLEIAEKLPVRNPILDMLPKLEKNDIMVDAKSEVAFCKKCSKALEFNHLLIENHIAEFHKEDKVDAKTATNKKENIAVNKKTEEKKSQKEQKKQVEANDNKKTNKKQERESESRASSVASSKDDEDIEKLVRANNLVYNRNSNKVYCPPCDTRVPAAVKNIQEHISGLSHKKKVIPTTVKKTMVEFVVNLTAIEPIAFESIDVIVNLKYVINYHSFLMITKVDGLKCGACDVDLIPQDVEKHKMTDGHHRAMVETKILVSMETEFIRELHEETYHCGFCNIIQTSFEDLERHLQSTSHREAKISSHWRLQQYLPEIMMNRQRCPPKILDVPDLLRMRMSGEA